MKHVLTESGWWASRRLADRAVGGNDQHLDLPVGEARTVRGGLVVVSGRVWLTDTSRPGDHLLGPGEGYRAIRGGRIVVEAIGGQSAVLRVVGP